MNAVRNIQDEARPLSVAQLAARWGCSQGLVRKLIDQKRLICFRPGALIRISAAEVERFECLTAPSHTASSGSGADSLSFINTKESASDASLQRKIDRAPRRKPAVNGKGPTIHRGPWAGS